MVYTFGKYPPLEVGDKILGERVGRKEGGPSSLPPSPLALPPRKGRRKKWRRRRKSPLSSTTFFLPPLPVFKSLLPLLLLKHFLRIVPEEGRGRGERRRHKKPYLTHFCCVDRGDEGNVRVRKNGGVGDGGGDPSPLSQTGQTSRGRRDGGGGRMKGDISRGGGLHSSFHARPELEEERHFEKKKMFDLCVWHWQKLIRERTKVFLGCSPISRCPLLVDRDASIRGRGRVYD